MFIGSVHWSVYGELFGYCSKKCGGSVPNLCMDVTLRYVERDIDVSSVGLLRCVGE